MEYNHSLEIIHAIKTMDSIISEENFSAYVDVRNRLNNCVELLRENNISATEKQLLLCIRLLMEAPTKNKELGLTALTQIDKVYKNVSKLIG